MPKYVVSSEDEIALRTAIARLEARAAKLEAEKPPTEDSILGARHDREGIELLGRCLAGEAPLETSPELAQEAHELATAQESLRQRGWALDDARRQAYRVGVLLRGAERD